MQLTGGRSVYSEQQLEDLEATSDRPVKVINYLLVSYIEPAISIDELRTMGVINRHPQQAIYNLAHDRISRLITRTNLAFKV